MQSEYTYQDFEHALDNLIEAINDFNDSKEVNRSFANASVLGYRHELETIVTQLATRAEDAESEVNRLNDVIDEVDQS